MAGHTAIAAAAKSLERLFTRAPPQRRPGTTNALALTLATCTGPPDPLVLRRALRVGSVDDALEREAEAVATAISDRPVVRRACACGGTPDANGECERCRVKRFARPQVPTGGAAVAPAIVHDVLRMPGRPLEPATIAAFQPRLGVELSGVRVHTGADAAASADALDADAYTVGQHVVFDAGRYAPGTAGGRRLLAHELAHVAQAQKGSSNATTVRRQVRGQNPTAATKIAGEFTRICPTVAWATRGQTITGTCEVSSTQGCECVCDVVNDPARLYDILVLPARAGTKSETMHDGTTRRIPDSSLWPNTVATTIETLDPASSGIEFGFFGPRGNANWYRSWRILAHELCGHARLGQGYAGRTGNRPGHDVTIDTENQIAAEHGEPGRGHFADRRQGEAFYNPVGSRSRVAFRQVDGWHYEAP